MSAAPTLARPTAKKDAVRDFEDAASAADVDALIEYAKSCHDTATSGDSKCYWLAYWGRMLELRRQHLQRRKVTPGSLRAV